MLFTSLVGDHDEACCQVTTRGPLWICQTWFWNQNRKRKPQFEELWTLFNYIIFFLAFCFVWGFVILYVWQAVESFNITERPIHLISLLQYLCFVYMSYLFGYNSVSHIYDAVQIHNCNCSNVGCEHQFFQGHPA